MLQLVQRVVARFKGRSLPVAEQPGQSAGRIFHRPELARRLAADLMSDFYDSGMFLTAPRRTGKSTFIQHDLKPALEAGHGALVLYVDLWERRKEDPGAVVEGLVEQALTSCEASSSGLLRRLRLSRLKAPGVELEVSRQESGQRLSLFQSLERLAKRSGKPVVLIVDEVQQTQTTAYGRDVLYMLKSARDQLNGRDRVMFRFLATGSHNEKIECLVSDKHQAFYLAPLEVLPTLGDDDYLSWARRIHGPRFDPELPVMARAFEICLRRPEAFHKACRGVAAMGPQSSETQEHMLLCLAREQIDLEKRKLFVRLQRLRPLEQAVLRLLAEDGVDFTPMFPDARRRLKAMLSLLPEDQLPQVTDDSIQAALDRLCEAKLVWCGDGPYALEESQFARWLLERPPVEVAQPASQVAQHVGLSVAGCDEAAA